MTNPLRIVKFQGKEVKIEPTPEFTEQELEEIFEGFRKEFEEDGSLEWMLNPDGPKMEPKQGVKQKWTTTLYEF